MRQIFSALPPRQGDPLLDLFEAFNRDRREYKVGLGIGLYFDEQGRLPVLDAVRKARADIQSQDRPCPYLPMEGSPPLRTSIRDLVFGEASEAAHDRRIATMQSLGGSGALRIGADFLHTQLGCSCVAVPDPTWDNHRALFEGAGYDISTYPYYDRATGTLAFPAMCGALRKLAPRTVVLLHASCHNPTGMDLSGDQWHELISLLQETDLVPFVDMAYQGFGEGLDADAAAVRALAASGLEFLVANSFSKNFSLYGERVGGLSVVCADERAAEAALGQLAAAVRKCYSSPPAHGALVVESILRSPQLRASWTQELDDMRSRMCRMRTMLHDGLAKRLGHSHDFAYLLAQRGMFSFTGLRPDQVQRLREGHAVYMAENGRMCVSGLTTSSVEHVADAMATVLSSND
jgi:aromatic-amino-acid transaminase